MYKCENCNEAEFETEQQLRGHQMKCRPKRKERIPFGVPSQRFSVSKEDAEKYHYHVFNDNWRKEPGRIERALNAGYEMVDHDRSGETAGTNEDGSEIKQVLMRIPKEMYDQDQAAKQAELDKIDEQIYSGRFKEGQNDNRYLPGSGIKTQTKLTG